MEKRWGCGGLLAATVLGAGLGILGLALAGMLWLERTVLEPQPKGTEPVEWSALDEGKLALKMAGPAFAVKMGKEGEFKLELTEKEANRLLEQYVFDDQPDLRVRLLFGDTATAVRVSKKFLGKWANSELRASIHAKAGDFTVKVFSLRTGRFEWPRNLLPEVGRWLEKILESQALFNNDPWQVEDYKLKRNLLKLKVRILAPAS